MVLKKGIIDMFSVKYFRTILSIFFSFCSTSLFSQTEYFISVEGKDSNAGSVEAPFASLEKALEEARKESGEVTLFLREVTLISGSEMIKNTPAFDQNTLGIYQKPACFRKKISIN